MKFKLHYMDIERSFIEKYNKRILESKNTESCVRDILQELEMVNISFSIEGVNTIQSIALKSIPCMNVDIMERDVLSFSDITISNDEIKLLYNELIERSKLLFDNLSKSGIIKDKSDLDYILPISKLKDCFIQTNVRTFLQFIQTCFTYNELNDIIQSMIDSDYVEDMLVLVELSNIENYYELFLRRQLDDVTRGEVVDNSIEGVTFETNMDMLYDKCIEDASFSKHMGSVLYTSYMTCSLKAYERLLDFPIKSHIKMENLFAVLVLGDYEFNMAIPDSIVDSVYYNDVIDHINFAADLSNKIIEFDEMSRDVLLVQMGSYMTIFKYNISVNKDIGSIKFIKDNCNLGELKKLMTKREEALLESPIKSLFY